MAINNYPPGDIELDAVGDTAAYQLSVCGIGNPSTSATSIIRAGTAGVWILNRDHLISVPAGVAASERVLTHLAWGNASAAVTAAYVAVLRTNGANYDHVGSSAISTTYGQHYDALATPISGIATGDILVLWCQTSAGNMAIRARNGGPAGHKYLDGGWSTGSIATASFTDGNYAPAVSAYITTKCKRVAVTSPALDGSEIEIPDYRGAPYWLYFPSITVTDGQTLAINFLAMQSSDSGNNHGKLLIERTITLDFGETNQISCAGNDVALAAGEEGCVFSLLVHIDPENKHFDFWWSNRTTGQAGGSSALDTTWLNHAVKVAAARGTRYTTYASVDEVKRFTRITIVSSGGTPAVGTIYVCRRPWIGGVSSWFVTGFAPCVLQHLGASLAACSAFANQPSIIPAGANGGTFYVDRATQKSFYAKFGLSSASVIGLHDVCEVRDACIVIEAGGIINDAVLTTIPATYKSTIIAPAIKCLSDIIYTAMAMGNEVVVCDLPPRTTTGDAIYVHHYDLRRVYNDALAALCRATGAMYVQTSPAITEPSTRHTVAERLATALRLDNTHLSTAAGSGNDIVAALIANRYESAIPARIQLDLKA